MMHLFNRATAQPDDAMHALGMTQEDELFNRTGRISDNQRELLQRARRSVLFLQTMPGIFIVAVAWFFIVPYFYRDMSTFISLELIFTLIIILVIGFGLHSAMRITQDLQDGTLEQKEGPVRLRMTRGGRSSSNTLYIIVDDLHLRVSSKVYRAFINGDYYRIYYVPRSKVMLNAIHNPLQRRIAL